ncbi:MAG: RluA family pseudouridine synthase [Selenomonadales bacterium]|nr:RluA family pseudouridine synthase [Selenomonadales bacterium]
MAFSIYTVTEQEASLSVRDFLKIHHVSARQVQKLTRSKGILLNGRPAFLKATLRAGDIVKIKQIIPQESSIQAEDLPIEVLYEDDYLIALNKPPRQLVHPAGRTTSGTLSNALAYYLKQNGKPVSFHPIHRLDRDTSGCVLFAKSADVQRELEKQRDTHTLTRTYRALVSGIPTEPEGTITFPIGAHPTLANRRAVRDDGDPAVTHYRTVSTYDNAALVELNLETGRTHQIRLHLSAIDLPILGDNMYGKRSALIKRQALHAVETSFIHPKTNERITVKAPLTADIETAIDLLTK